MIACTIHTTEADALATCAAIDAALGYPRIDLDQLGREVVTERYALPIALADGRWVVTVTPEVAQAASLTTTTVDIRATRKLVRDTDAVSVRSQAYLDATRAEAAKLRAPKGGKAVRS